MKTPFTRLVLAGTAAAIIPLSLQAARTNTWVSLTGGNWSSTANWLDSSFYPNGTDDVAIIASRPPNNDDTTKATITTITLDVPVTLGELHVRNRNFTIAATTGNRLTMAATGKPAVLKTYERIQNITVQPLFNTSVHIATDTEILAGDMGLKFATTSLLTSSDDNVALTLNMNTPSQGDAVLELGDSSGYTGTMTIKRDSTGGAGCNFATSDARFPSGPVVVQSTGYARFAAPLTDARIAQLTIQPGATLLFRSTASVAGCGSTGLPKFLNSTKLTLGETNTTAKDRWGNSDPLDMIGTQLTLAGPPSSSSVEIVGAATFAKGSVLNLKGSADAYEISLETDSLARVGTGTLNILSDSSTWYVGTASSQFTIGSPVLNNGRFHPSMVLAKREGTSSASLLLPYLCGYDATYGVVPLPYALTNSFGTAQQTVLVQNTLNLAGATVDAFAVAGGIAGSDGNFLYNGIVRIDSGFLAMKGNFYRYAANFIMGANGTGEALIYVVSSSSGDFRRLDGLTGSVACNGFTKFGPGIVRLSGNNTNLLGTIRVNQGQMAIDAAQAVRNTNDVWICGEGRLTVSADAVTLGGLASDANAILQMEYPDGNTTLSLNPPTGSESVFQGTVQNKAGVANVMTIEIAGEGVQGFSGTVGSPIVIKTGGTLKVADNIAGYSLSCENGSTLVTSTPSQLTLTAASSLPASLVLTDSALAEGEYVLISSDAALSGDLPSLDYSASDYPQGMTPTLRKTDHTVILAVAPQASTVIVVR